MRHSKFYGLEHFMFWFTHTHAADGVAVEFHGHKGFGAFLAQCGIRTALDDAEDFLTVGARLFAAFARPADGAFHGVALLTRGRVVRRAFVKDHCDVRAERPLD